MFDQIVLVKIIEMQNDADRLRWRKDEDAFYRDLAHSPGDRFIQFWLRLRSIRLRIGENKTDRQLRTDPLSNTCSHAPNQAAR